MVFGPQALAPGPGTKAKATFRTATDSIRFERFTVFKPPALPEAKTQVFAH